MDRWIARDDAHRCAQRILRCIAHAQRTVWIKSAVAPLRRSHKSVPIGHTRRASKPVFVGCVERSETHQSGVPRCQQIRGLPETMRIAALSASYGVSSMRRLRSWVPRSSRSSTASELYEPVLCSRSVVLIWFDANVLVEDRRLVLPLNGILNPNDHFMKPKPRPALFAAGFIFKQ